MTFLFKPTLATKEHKRAQRESMQVLIYVFFAFLCGKGLFLGGMREFRAPPPAFYFFEGVTSRDWPRLRSRWLPKDPQHN
jgi:hypothetical protein